MESHPLIIKYVVVFAMLKIEWLCFLEERSCKC